MWYDCLSRNKFLLMLYKSVPELTKVDIVNFGMSDRGFNITITFIMDSIPDFPPKKWNEAGYNSMAITLDFFAISKLKINTDSNDYIGNIEINRTEDGLIYVRISGNIEAEFKAEGGLIQSIEGLISSDINIVN